MKSKNILYAKLVSLILLLALAVLFAVNIINGGFSMVYFKEKLLDSQKFENISKIDLSAVSASVEVESCSGNEIIYEYYASSENNIPKAEANEETLKITQPSKSGINFFGSSIIIKVPEKDLLSYNIKTVSGSVKLDAVCSDADIESVSGSIKTYRKGENISAASTSGSVQILSAAETVNAESVSGSIKIKADEKTKTISADSTSGSVKINLPEASGYSLKFSTTSGSVKDEYRQTSFEKKGETSYNGTSSQMIMINASTVSGSIKLCDFED